MKKILYKQELKSKKYQIIKDGDILLCSNNTFISKAIRFFQKNKYSHAGLFIYINDRLFVAEATKRGITLTNYYEYLNKKNNNIKIIKYKDIDKLNYELYFDLIMNNLSKPYDYISLLFYEPIRFIFKKWIGKKNKGDEKFMCGEFVAYIYYKLFNLFDNWYEIAPVDIEKNDNFQDVIEVI
mgnify:CR=1 FL=1